LAALKAGLCDVNRIGSFVIVLTVFVLGAACASTGQHKAFQLTILHSNDVHSRLLPINKIDQTCSDKEMLDKKCFGGVARRVSEVDRIRKQKGNVLLLDAGDQFQGTLFYNKYKGDEAKQFMNEMGYAAMAVGNHEFDSGPRNLARFIRGVHFPVLSANIDASKESSLAGLIKPYTVISMAGEQVGIVGFTTEETSYISAPGPNVQFLPIEPAVQKVVDELKAKGVDKIIGLSHSGYGRDLQVASTVTGLDVIVGGHSNTYLSNIDKSAQGPYPTVVTSPDGNPVLVVSAYAYGKFLGDLDVGFDEKGKVISWGGEPILLDESVSQDPSVLKEVAELEKPLDKLRHEVVGYLPKALEGGSGICRLYECEMGDVLTDAIFELAKSYGAQAAFTNGGGVRTGIAKGPVTRWQIMDSMPFSNEVVVFDIEGKDLWDAFEFGVGQSEDVRNEGTARFLQVSGLRYTWNPAVPAGSRMVSLEIESKGVWSSIQKDTIYRVASNRFLTSGGDGYEILRQKAKNVTVLSETIDEAFSLYIAPGHRRPLKTGGRILRQK
jgi:5'-nucleotidase/UDP-sugar diphosphatase